MFMWHFGPLSGAHFRHNRRWDEVAMSKVKFDMVESDDGIALPLPKAGMKLVRILTKPTQKLEKVSLKGVVV